MGYGRKNPATIKIDNPNVAELESQLAQKVTDLEQRSININQPPFNASTNSDITQILKDAINYIKTVDRTEAIPANTVKSIIYIPAGKYKISSKIVVPSYIHIKGAGKNATILESYITNGDPVLFLTYNETIPEQQFYNVVSNLTVEGRGQMCQGIKIKNVSRWELNSVIINNTLHEGLYTYESYIGEVNSCLVRACGDATHSSVVYDGSDSNHGAHATTWFGGEVNGGGSSVNGIDIRYGNSVRFIGATIQGFTNGLGIRNGNGLGTVVDSCYFEENKGHIECTDAYSFNIKGNLFGLPRPGSLGYIVVKNMYAGLIEGNFFAGTGFDHIGAKDASVKLHYSKIGFNYVTGFPIRITQSLIDSGRITGTIIETFDNSFYNSIYGQTQYKDVLTSLSEFRPVGGINDISGQQEVKIASGVGSPEGVVTATRGIYIDVNGGLGASVYIKTSGTNNAFNWRPLQELRWCTTATRPVIGASEAGYMAYDNTLNKPIWWNGGVWKDAMGTTV
jgi:hypothetical protein